MLDQVKKVFGRTYYPLNKITISRKNLVSNYTVLVSISPKIKISPVLKSNAYGHGIVQIAKILDPLNCPYFCVDSLYEAYELLKAKINTPVLIMGYINPENLKVKSLPFSYAVYEEKLISVINKYQKGAKVHLKVDTGMNRLGITLDKLKVFTKRLHQFKNINIEGLMSHFASGDEPESNLTKLQIESFKKAKQILAQFNIFPRWNHIAASNGLLNMNVKKLSEISNLARVGIALYGINATHEGLKPVLKLTSQVVQIKKLQKGDIVGYSGAFEAIKAMTIGILPIGYNDGVDRRFSNKGVVLVNDQPSKIIGNVSMNITAVDLSRVKNPKIGQVAVIFSDRKKDPNTIEKESYLCGTIPYVLLVHLSPTSIKREIV